jgi:hypothetical protein
MRVNTATTHATTTTAHATTHNSASASVSTSVTAGKQNTQFSLVSPITSSHSHSHSHSSSDAPLKSGFLDLHSGGSPESPSRLYCVLTSTSLKCYANSPDDSGLLSKSAVPEYELRVSDYALTDTRSGRPQAFALLNKKKTHAMEFLCRNIGAMNQWTSFLKVCVCITNYFNIILSPNFNLFSIADPGAKFTSE